MATPPQKPRSGPSFHKEIADTLREEIRRLTAEVQDLDKALRTSENARLSISSRMTAAESAREALYSAVRVLAAAVPYTTAPGRRVRKEARKYLEVQKIPPPHSLGVSRSRKKKRKRVLTDTKSSIK